MCPLTAGAGSQNLRRVLINCVSSASLFRIMEREINSARYHTNVTSVISGSGSFTAELFVWMSYYSRQDLANKQKHQAVTKS